jgi:hypothetical protein
VLSTQLQTLAVMARDILTLKRRVQAFNANAPRRAFENAYPPQRYSDPGKFTWQVNEN